MPSSPFVRSRKFVAQEWNAVFAGNASTPANKVEGGWQGVLYANLALVDPQTSWKYFSRDGFDYGTIDGGATRTWYLAFAAGKSTLLAQNGCACADRQTRAWRMSLMAGSFFSVRLLLLHMILLNGALRMITIVSVECMISLTTVLSHHLSFRCSLSREV